jgi:hypothetical protein
MCATGVSTSSTRRRQGSCIAARQRHNARHPVGAEQHDRTRAPAQRSGRDVSLAVVHEEVGQLSGDVVIGKAGVRDEVVDERGALLVRQRLPLRPIREEVNKASPSQCAQLDDRHRRGEATTCPSVAARRRALPAPPLQGGRRAASGRRRRASPPMRWPHWAAGPPACSPPPRRRRAPKPSRCVRGRAVELHEQHPLGLPDVDRSLQPATGVHPGTSR